MYKYSIDIKYKAATSLFSFNWCIITSTGITSASRIYCFFVKFYLKTDFLKSKKVLSHYKFTGSVCLVELYFQWWNLTLHCRCRVVINSATYYCISRFILHKESFYIWIAQNIKYNHFEFIFFPNSWQDFYPRKVKENNLILYLIKLISFITT